MSGTKSVSLPISGMSCSNCALAIERKLRKQPGIVEANVDLGSERLVAVFDPGTITVPEIIALVDSLGYSAITGKVELPVVGLATGESAKALEEALGQQTGVLSCKADSGTGLVSIEYIPGMASVTGIASLIRERGFDFALEADPKNDEAVEARERTLELKRQKNLLFVGLAFTLPLVAYSMAHDFRLVALAHDRYYMLAAATVVQFVVGWQFYVGAFRGLRSGGANMDVLIVLASSVAYLSSLLVTVGLIASVTKPFCGDCNRLRLTADGMLRYCLFALHETDLKPLLAQPSDEPLAAAFRSTVAAKWPGHQIGQPQFVPPPRPMNAIGG